MSIQFSSTLIRRCAVVAALLLSFAAQAQAPSQQPQSQADSPCVDRIPPVLPNAQGKLPDAPPLLRLPELSYSCIALRSGQHVLVGRGGAPTQPIVLLVHGLGQNAHRDWSRSAAGLTRQFQVIALDLPGFGASPNPKPGYSFELMGNTLVELLDQLAPGQRVHLIGHSLGGALSLYFAHRYPERLERLVLVDAAGILFKAAYARHLTNVRLQPSGFEPVDRVLSRVDERINTISRALFDGMDERFDFTRWLAQNASVRQALLGPYLQADAALRLVEHDFSAAIRETKTPTTIIWGSRDTIAPLRTGKLLAARLPDARLHVMDEVGHVPMQEQPEEFLRLVVQALRGSWPAKTAPVMDAVSQGDVSCNNANNRRYRGRFDSLTLVNCTGVRIDDAQIGQLRMVGSTALIENSSITSEDVAIDAQSSRLTATAVDVRGRIGIRADGSFLDLAGLNLQTSERNVEVLAPSRLYFSVSELRGGDFSGNAHLVWPSAALRPARSAPGGAEQKP